MQVMRRYFAASKFWQETLGALFGGMGGGVPQFGGVPNMPSAPDASGGGRSSPSSTTHQFPTGFD